MARNELMSLRDGQRGTFFETRVASEPKTNEPRSTESYDDANPTTTAFHTDPFPLLPYLLPAPSRWACAGQRRKEQLSIRDSQSEIDGEETQGDVGGWGAETIEGSAAATGEAFATGLATQPLDAVRTALAVTDQSVKRWSCVAQVVAVRTWAGITGGADGLGAKRTACAWRSQPGQGGHTGWCCSPRSPKLKVSPQISGFPEVNWKGGF